MADRPILFSAPDAAQIRADALREAADVDWSYGRDTTDTAPDYLTDWQRGLVSGQKAMRDAILALIDIPPAAPNDVAALVEALRDIARQKRTDEMETEFDVENADFEGGYDAIIDIARAALTKLKVGS